MNGIEKITGRIEADAQEQAKAIAAEAEAKKWRTEPTFVAMTGDEVWLAVKFQTNLEIAGSPRNSFRTSVGYEFNGGKALNGLGGDKLTEPYQTKNAV